MTRRGYRGTQRETQLRERAPSPAIRGRRPGANGRPIRLEAIVSTPQRRRGNRLLGVLCVPLRPLRLTRVPGFLHASTAALRNRPGSTASMRSRRSGAGSPSTWAASTSPARGAVISPREPWALDTYSPPPMDPMVGRWAGLTQRSAARPGSRAAPSAGPCRAWNSARESRRIGS